MKATANKQADRTVGGGPGRAQDTCAAVAAAVVPTILALLSVVGVSPARAEFVPGYAYVADGAIPPCFDGGPPDRIWEVNPQTGESRVFATIPPQYCGGLTGLTFTPDGRHLRASAAIAGSVLEVDSDGNVGVALDREDGLVFPIGASNLAYDRAGSFWVGDFFPARVLRFPSASGPPETVLDGSNSLVDVAAITSSRSGTMWIAQAERRLPNLFRVSSEGDVTPLHLDGLLPVSIAVGDAEMLYVHSGNFGVFKVPGGDPDQTTLLADDDLPGDSLALSIDGSRVFVAGVNEFVVVDVLSGDVLLRSDIAGSNAGTGIAVYVPEAATLMLVPGAFMALRSRHRKSKG